MPVMRSGGGGGGSPLGNQVELSEIASIADQTILGNGSGGAAAPSALTKLQASTILLASGFSFAAESLIGGNNYLRLTDQSTSMKSLSVAGLVVNAGGMPPGSATGFAVAIGYYNAGLRFLSGVEMAWSSSASDNSSPDTYLFRGGVATLRLGAAANATPVSCVLQVGEDGSGTNIAGGGCTIRSGAGSGNAAASSIVFKTPDVGASGSTPQGFATRVTISSSSMKLESGVPLISDTSAAFRYSPATNTISLGYYSGNELGFGSAITIGWASGSYSGTSDVGLARAAAARVKVTDGSTGYGTIDIDGTDAAGASAGTLTNAPAAGNPAKFLKIYAGGTLYKIPAWT